MSDTYRYREIPDTGDTESLNVCVMKHGYQNKKKRTEREKKNSCVMCKMSCVMCHMLGVTCHLSHITGLQRPKNLNKCQIAKRH